jgi:hypothetical protein
MTGKLLMIFLTITFPFFIFAQTVEIHVKDAASSEPLAYAGIHLLHSHQAFYTDEKGYAKINHVNINDTIFITYVGYSEKILPLQQLKKSVEILLEQKSINLNEVVVINDIPILKPLLVGTLKKAKNIYFDLTKNQEFALKINIPDDIKKYIVLKIIICGVTKSENDNPIRLHLYEDNNGLPGNELLTRDILANNSLISHNKKLEIDISKMSLKLNNSILYVGVESIITSPSTVVKNSLFNFKRGAYFTSHIPEALTYVRVMQNFQWHTFDLVFKNVSRNPLNLIAGVEIQQLKE